MPQARTGGFDAAAMQIDQAPDQAQRNARPAVRLRRRGCPGLGKQVEHRWQHLRRNADSLVVHAHQHRICLVEYASSRIVPPSGVNLAALLSRFVMTWVMY